MFYFYDQAFFISLFLHSCSCGQATCRSVCLVELDQSLQGLLSFERLDRASPDLWPEQSELQFMDLILSTDANKLFKIG